jgi:hypothetical protein
VRPRLLDDNDSELVRGAPASRNPSATSQRPAAWCGLAGTRPAAAAYRLVGRCPSVTSVVCGLPVRW